MQHNTPQLEKAQSEKKRKQCEKITTGKKTQHEKNATQGECNIKRRTSKKSNVKKVKYERNAN